MSKLPFTGVVPVVSMKTSGTEAHSKELRHCVTCVFDPLETGSDRILLSPWGRVDVHTAEMRVLFPTPLSPMTATFIGI